jgi:selenocysteine lyase
MDRVYLDYNATTPLDNQVIDAISLSLCKSWHNPSGQSDMCKNVKYEINQAREQLATMINAPISSDILFTSGGTEANNMVFHSVLKYFNSNFKKSLPHFIISSIEHDSVKLVAENLQKNGLIQLSEVAVNEYGSIKVSDVLSIVKENTVLISIMLANNETGVIQPIKALTKQIKELETKIFIHTDAAQAIGKINVNVQDLDVDYLTIVGHKFYGPRIGALYVRGCLMQDKNQTPIYPLLFGGGQENNLRPGTENTPMIIGLGKAAELVTKNLTKYNSHMNELREYLESRLENEFIVKFNGRSLKTQRLPNTCNVSFIGSPLFIGYDILKNCDRLDASTGAACHSGQKRASRILLAMGISIDEASNAIRLSVGRETTKKEIDEAVEDIRNALKKLNCFNK